MIQHVEMEVGTPTQPMRLKADGVDLMQFGIRELRLDLGPPTSSRDCAGVPTLTITYSAKRFSANMVQCDVKEWLYCQSCGAHRPLPEIR
jgi:hypothetical protein